jgi:hypothetical protein
MLEMLVRLHVEGVLSEGQVARAAQLDRVSVRRLADSLLRDGGEGERRNGRCTESLDGFLDLQDVQDRDGNDVDSPPDGCNPRRCVEVPEPCRHPAASTQGPQGRYDDGLRSVCRGS